MNQFTIQNKNVILTGAERKVREAFRRKESQYLSVKLKTLNQVGWFEIRKPNIYIS